ncbi:hypothetical protein C9426_02995 [Serratia sp. S1B]|nr:hypothetical protein C9426_02995 [Serratia sp. S1B]
MDEVLRGMNETSREKAEEYCPIIYLIEDFAHSFGLTIEKLSYYLLRTNFTENIYAYVNINKTDYVKLDKKNSKKAISHLLNIFNDKKYNNSLLSVIDDDNINELDHIHIKRNDLYNFTPLKELDFDYCIGYQFIGKVSLKEVDYKELEKARKAYIDAQPQPFSEEWYALHPKLQELRNTPVDEPIATIPFKHPSLDQEDNNYAPELLLAIQAWESKYISNEYPHMEHTPAIKAFLTKTGYTGVRLQERIAAITNPKNINKSDK